MLGFHSALGRWNIGKDNVAETGSNAGSNFRIFRYDDGGDYLGIAMTIVRATGNVNFGGYLGVGVEPTQRLTVAEDSAGVATYIYNVDASGYGVKIRGGSASYYALNVVNYDDTNACTIYGDGEVNIAQDVSSYSFVSGFSGSGWKIDASTTTLTVDNLFVRNSLTAYEMVINKVSSIAGSLIISPANMRSYSKGTLGGDDWRIYFDEGGSTASEQIPFVASDFVKAQVFTGRSVASFLGTVTAVAHSSTLGSAYIDVTKTAGDDPWDVMDLCQVGHASTASRQNLIYMTSADSNNPYIDVLAGVTDGTFSGKTKVRLGNLTGITDASFGGALSGYGLYSDNIYIKGAIVASSGVIGGWSINSTSIYTGTEDHAAYTGSAGHLTIYSSGSAASIHAYNFYIDAAGDIYARGGTIGGFTLSSTALTAGSIGSAGWASLSSTGVIGLSGLQSYVYSQQSTPVTLSAPVPYAVALDNDSESTLNLPSSGLPGSGTSCSMFIIHAEGTGLGAGKYHIQGNGYNINRGGTQASSFDLDEGEAVLLVWDPRQSGQWYVIG